MNLFATLVFRIINRYIGLNIRYLFFMCIGKKIGKRKLTNEYDKLYDDYGAALKQDFYNALVGTTFVLLIILLAVNIIFR